MNYLKEHEKKLLQLIKVLESKESWVNTSYLAEQINCTEKTIRKYLEQLREFLPANWEILSKKGTGIRLNKPKDATIQTIESKILQSTTIYKIISLLITEKNTSVSELAHSLYFNNTIVIQALNEVSNILKKYNLTLQKIPLKVTGSELQIRFCLNKYYQEFYGIVDFPCTFIEFFKIKSFIVALEKNLMTKLSTLEKRDFIFYVAIMINRIRQNNHFQLPSSFQVPNTHFVYKAVENSTSTLEEEFLLTLSKDEKYYLFYSLLFIDIDKKNEMRNELINDYSFYESEEFDTLTKLLTSFEKDFGLEIEKNTDILSLFVSYYKRVLLRNEMKLIKPHSRLTRSIEKQYNDLFYRVKRTIKKWEVENNQHLFSDYDICELILNFKTLIDKKEKKYKKALLLLGEGRTYEHFIKSELMKKFQNQLKIIEPNNFQFNEAEVNKLNVDFIITNIISSKQISIPVIQISTIPHERDLQAIRFELNKN